VQNSTDKLIHLDVKQKKIYHFMNFKLQKIPKAWTTCWLSSPPVCGYLSNFTTVCASFEYSKLHNTGTINNCILNDLVLIKNTTDTISKSLQVKKECFIHLKWNLLQNWATAVKLNKTNNQLGCSTSSNPYDTLKISHHVDVKVKCLFLKSF